MKKGYFEEDSIKMQIKDLRKVKKIRFSFDEINMCFLCVDVGDYLFLYKDIECYTDLLKLIAGKSDKVGIELRKYEKDFGIVHELWKQLLDVTFKKFSTQTSHIKNGLRTLKNQYFNPQNSNHAALCPYFNASCIYFGSL